MSGKRFLIATFVLIHASIVVATPVDLFVDAQFNEMFIEVEFDFDYSGLSGDFFDTFSTFITITSNPAEVLSPAVATFLNANLNVTGSLSYDTDGPAIVGLANNFRAGPLVVNLTDPGDGTPTVALFSNANMQLVNDEENGNTGEDFFNAFSSPGSSDSIVGFDEILDDGPPPTIFTDLSDAGGQFGSLAGRVSDSLLSELTGDLTLPFAYEIASGGRISLFDSTATALDSAQSLPPLSVSDFDRGFLVYDISGDSDDTLDFFSPEGESGTASNFRIMFRTAYDVTNFSGGTTPSGIIDQFNQTGQLPADEIPGVFDLPDAMGVPGSGGSALIGGETFETGVPFLFTGVDLSQPRRVFDPDIAVGYDFQLLAAASGQGFSDVLVPTVGGDGEFWISVFDPNLQAFLDPAQLLANTTFDVSGFGFDVQRFAVTGIDPLGMLDPNDPLAFPALIGFLGTGVVTLQQTPFVVPEPTALTLILIGVLSALGRRGRQ
jgi:hypothetical protein